MTQDVNQNTSIETLLMEYGDIIKTKQTNRYTIYDVALYGQRPSIKEIKELAKKYGIVVRILGYIRLYGNYSAHLVCTPNICYIQVWIGYGMAKTPNAFILRVSDIVPFKQLMKMLEPVVEELLKTEIGTEDSDIPLA